MICYEDRTFCDFYNTCKKGNKCHSACTDKIKSGAENFGLPICHYTYKPDCYKEIENETK